MKKALTELLIFTLTILGLTVVAMAQSSNQQTIIKIGDLPPPPSGGIFLVQGDIVPGNRTISGKANTYQMRIGFGAVTCGPSQWVNAISPNGTSACVQPGVSDIAGLGSAATVAIGTGGATLGLLNTANFYSANSTFTQGVVVGTSTTGGFEGAGSLNASALYINGVAVTGGASPIVVGTSAALTNPSRSGQTNTGLFSQGSGTLSIGASGTEVLRANTLASGVDFVSVTAGTSAAAPIITAGGTTTNQGLTIKGKGTGSLALNTLTIGTTGIVTNETYDTAGSGNVFKINGVQVNAVSGTGGAMLQQAATFLTSLTGPQIIGGVANSSTLTLASTSTSGTTDALIFQTNLTTRMTIAHDGGVEIGTNTSNGVGTINLGSSTPIFVNGTAWSSGGGGGGGQAVIGTSATAANPQLTSDLNSGFFSTAAQTINGEINQITVIGLGTNTVTGIPQVNINGAIAYTQNTDPVQMPHFRKCMTNVNTGNTAGANGGRCRILGIGASVDYGYGSQGGGNDVKTYAWLNQLARYLSMAYGVPADFNGEFGNSDNGQYNTSTGADPRWTALTGMTNSTGNLTLGGQYTMLNANTVAANYKPDQFWNTAIVWISKYTSGPSIGLAIDSGSVTTVNTNATAVVASTTLTTGTAGIHTLNFTCPTTNCSTAQGFVSGYEFFDSAHPGISVMGAGAYGDTTTNIVSTNPNNTTYNATAVIQTIAPDVVVLGGDMLANDANAGIPVATTKSNLHTLFVAIKAQSDLVCVTSQHATTPYSDATMMPYMQAMIAQCKADGAIIADNWSAQNSYTPFTTSSGGLNWSFDTAHLNQMGYNDWAANVAYTLLQAVHSENGMRPSIMTANKATDVNSLYVTGGATGANPTVFALSASDTNLGFTFTPKGTGGFNLSSGTYQIGGTQIACSNLSNGATGCSTATGTSGATIPLLNAANTWSAGQAVTPTAGGTQSAGGTLTPDFSASNSITFTFGAGNLTVANPTNIKAGQNYIISATQDATGSRTITWGNEYKCTGGCASAIVLSTAGSARDDVACFAVSTVLLDCGLMVKGAQ